jgi:hypothetical protein
MLPPDRCPRQPGRVAVTVEGRIAGAGPLAVHVIEERVQAGGRAMQLDY